MKKKLTIKQRKINVWKNATIFLGIVLLILITADFVENRNKEQIQNTDLVDSLIENKIVFVYSSQCSACHKQIEIFGDNWNKYENSGLTLDCATHSSEICMNIRVTPSWVVNNGTAYIVIGEGVIGQ